MFLCFYCQYFCPYKQSTWIKKNLVWQSFPFNWRVYRFIFIVIADIFRFLPFSFVVCICPTFSVSHFFSLLAVFWMDGSPFLYYHSSIFSSTSLKSKFYIFIPLVVARDISTCRFHDV